VIQQSKLGQLTILTDGGEMRKGKKKKEWKQNQEGDEFAASDENRMQGVVEKEVKRYCESEIKSKRRINSVCGESKVVVAKVEQSQR
jgi:hypothetical protein